MNLDAINSRVDSALRSNHRAEIIVISMAVGIFMLGAGILLIAYWSKNPYVGGGTFLAQSFLYWPIREILKLRKENLVVQMLPVLVAQLPQKEAILEIRQLTAYLKAKK